MLPEKTKEKLKQYESSLRKKRRLNKRVSPETRQQLKDSLPQTRTRDRVMMLEKRNWGRKRAVLQIPGSNFSTGVTNSECDASEITGNLGASSTESSVQEASTSGHLPQILSSSLSTSQPDVTSPPPLDTREEEHTAMERDCHLDQRDNQTGEFVSSDVVVPLTAASDTPSSLGCFTQSSSTQAQGLPMPNPTPTSQPFVTVLPVVSGDNIMFHNDNSVVVDLMSCWVVSPYFFRSGPLRGYAIVTPVLDRAASTEYTTTATASTAISAATLTATVHAEPEPA